MPARTIALFAWRLLVGNRRAVHPRRRITGAVVGVALSLVPLVFVQQVADGMIGGIARRFIETGSYHLQARARTAPDPEAVAAHVAALSTDRALINVATERRGFGLIYSPTGRSGVTIRAVDAGFWREDAAVAELLETVAGRMELDTPDAIVLGTQTAGRLAVGPGDQVRLLTLRTREDGGSLPRISRFEVRGVVSSGYRDLDAAWVFIDHDRGRRIIPDDAAVDLIGFKIEDPYALPNPLTRRGLKSLGESGATARMVATRARVASLLGPQWSLQDWYSAEQARYISFLTSRNLIALVMAVIAAVASINISAALVMLVVEKRDDIAVLRATGARRRDIARIFLAAGVVIGGLGGTAGAAVGLVLAGYVNEVITAVEFVLSTFSGSGVELLNSDFYLERIPVEPRLIPVWTSLVLALVLGALAAVLPARRAAAIRPARVLRRHLG